MPHTNKVIPRPSTPSATQTSHFHLWWWEMCILQTAASTSVVSETQRWAEMRDPNKNLCNSSHPRPHQTHGAPWKEVWREKNHSLSDWVSCDRVYAERERKYLSTECGKSMVLESYGNGAGPINGQPTWKVPWAENYKTWIFLLTLPYVNHIFLDKSTHNPIGTSQSASIMHCVFL